MPVKNGRWVPWATVLAEDPTTAVEVEAEPEAPVEQKARRQRRTRKNAAAAIAEATGVAVDVPEAGDNEAVEAAADDSEQSEED